MFDDTAIQSLLLVVFDDIAVQSLLLGVFLNFELKLNLNLLHGENCKNIQSDYVYHAVGLYLK